MMSLLKKAQDRAKSSVATSKPKKNTSWVVDSSDAQRAGKVAKALAELTSINADMKALEARKKIHAGIVSEYAHEQFINDFSDLGVLPDTPMRVVDSHGNSVTYVVQDRSGQYNIKPEQIGMLENVLGVDAAQDLLYTESTFSFNRLVMAIPGVAEAIDKALTSAVKRMVTDKVLTEEDADSLLEVGEKTAFKPGTLDRAAMLVGRDKTRLSQFIDAMGSSCCRYVK